MIKQGIYKIVFLAALATMAALTAARAAKADTVYNVSGTFANSTVFTGPLNGGSFNGTFSATLPATGPVETITTFDINLVNSAGVTLVNLTSSNGGAAVVYVYPSNCATSASATGPCDAFAFGNASLTDQIQLTTPTGFTGGAVTPGFLVNGVVSSFGFIGGQSTTTDSAVASGSITTTPEPASLLLFGTGLLELAYFVRRRQKRGAVEL